MDAAHRASAQALLDEAPPSPAGTASPTGSSPSPTSGATGRAPSRGRLRRGDRQPALRPAGAARAPSSRPWPRRYRTFDGVADLYVYFYELGLRLLRPGGRLSFVVTNKWLRAGYAEKLREHVRQRAWLEAMIDFGHAKGFFPAADVFPCVVVVRPTR